jgi:hypothetical protein
LNWSPEDKLNTLRKGMEIEEGPDWFRTIQMPVNIKLSDCSWQTPAPKQVRPANKNWFKKIKKVNYQIN